MWPHQINIMNLCHQLLLISIAVIVTVIMIKPGRLIQKLMLIMYFFLQLKTFLITSQGDSEFITKNINAKFFRPPDELVYKTVNYSLEGNNPEKQVGTLFLLSDEHYLE